MGQNDCVGRFALEKRALELAAFKPGDRTAQNAAPIAATADRSVKPAFDEEPQGEAVDRLQIATGAALVLAPSILGHLLLGQNLVGAALLIARVAGIALIGLAIACWPGPPQAGMLTYSAGVTVFLGYAGYTAGATGALLWPRSGPSCRSDCGSHLVLGQRKLN
ncbi:MAG: hypothetical protein ACXU9C_12785 [Xanthobacteraceae bacterium]